jgi:alpha-galactosidase
MNLRGIDAECFTKWGADILKVDSCRPPSSSAKYAQGVMSAWRGLLPQNISVYNSRYGCLAKTTCGGVYKCPLDTNIKANRHIQGYCSATADVARLGPDMEPHWPNIIAGLSTRLGRGRIARPGFWVDPDFLVPNLTTLTYQETRVQFSAWCITSSPLLISVDLTQTSSEIFDMLSNKDAIRINQQYFSTGGDLWYMWGVIWVLRKQISATELAVLIINVDSTYRRNAGPKKGTVRYTFPTLAGLTAVESSGPVQSCSAKNIWENTTFTLTKATIFPIEPRDCVFLLVSNCQ